jgi:TetR/AcrR family transcriptional repressor of nem operon
MMSDQNMRDRILDAAEARARRGGYNAFSFREIALDVGISSAAVHYHFPAKADLAKALTTRYTARTMERLGDPLELDAAQASTRVHELFRDALGQDDQMCLCGLLGAERDILPAGVDTAVAAFFDSILDYLRTASRGTAREAPEAILAKLEGALILARSLRDTAVFDRATADLTR